MTDLPPNSLDHPSPLPDAPSAAAEPDHEAATPEPATPEPSTPEPSTPEPSTPEPSSTIPAATVVVVRPALVDSSPGVATPPPSGIEVLLLRRNVNLAFAGGHWVFPGGRVDLVDRRYDDTSPETDAARRAAVREATEEAGLTLDPHGLVWFAHWTPPSRSNKRFATWFFIAALPPDADSITIDGGEIHEHTWLSPSDALRSCDAGEIELSPPTWITLEYLSLFDAVDQLLDHARSRPAEYFATRIAALDDAIVALYDGDAGYATSDATAPGARHRLSMQASGWVYERDGWPPSLS